MNGHGPPHDDDRRLPRQEDGDPGRTQQRQDSPESRQEWFRRTLDLGRAEADPLPLYRSDAWEVLPPGSPAKIAAVAVAAECWRREGEPEAIAARIRAELDEVARAAGSRIRQASWDVRDAMAAPIPDDPQGRSLLGRMTSPGYALSHAELAARREADWRSARIVRLEARVADQAAQLRRLRAGLGRAT